MDNTEVSIVYLNNTICIWYKHPVQYNLGVVEYGCDHTHVLLVFQRALKLTVKSIV